jgi:hypothetical protein
MQPYYLTIGALVEELIPPRLVTRTEARVGVLNYPREAV